MCALLLVSINLHTKFALFKALVKISSAGAHTTRVLIVVISYNYRSNVWT